jgi:predicted GIY-YIG superfamily endonuclease
MQFFYVYILLCRDNRTYVGCTDNLKSRLTKHQKGYIDATKNRLPVELIAYFALQNEHTAFNFEQYLKSGSGRAFLKKHLFQTQNP